MLLIPAWCTPSVAVDVSDLVLLLFFWILVVLFFGHPISLWFSSLLQNHRSVSLDYESSSIFTYVFVNCVVNCFHWTVLFLTFFFRSLFPWYIQLQIGISMREILPLLFPRIRRSFQVRESVSWFLLSIVLVLVLDWRNMLCCGEYSVLE